MAVASQSRSARSPRAAAASKVSPEEKLVASLIARLEAGTTPWRREWDASAGGHHVNLLCGQLVRVLFLDREGHIYAQPHNLLRCNALILAANQQRVLWAQVRVQVL